MNRWLSLLCLGLLWTACSNDDDGKKPRAKVIQVRMLADADLDADFFAQPFPLETRRVDGKYSLAGLPNPSSIEIIDFFKQELAKGLDGYGTNAAVYFQFTGDLAFEGSVTDAESSAQGKAAVLLVNIDPKSADYKKFTPVWSHFYRGNSRYLPLYTLAVLPKPGFSLRGDTLYAAVVLRDYGLAGKGGVLKPAPALSQALAGKGVWGETFQPLATALGELGIAPASVAAATVYRTIDVVSPLFKARDWLYAAGPTGDARIDAFLTYGTRKLIRGTFESVRFQHGISPFVDPGEGSFTLDSKGVPQAVANERLRFSLMLPAGSMPAAGWPIVIYAHGTGGDYESYTDDEGWELSAKGIAVVSYDQPYHGPRNPRIEDCTDTCPQLYTFNFLNPPAGRDGFRQSALDAVQLTRAMLDLEFQFNGAGSVHRLDASKVYYMGHSQGSTSGPLFVAAEKTVKAAVFSGPAGGLTMAFIYKVEPIDIPAIAATVFGDPEAFDIFHPVLNVFQAYSEPADPINYARYVGQEPRDASTVRDVLATEGLIDGYTPPIQAEAFALALRVSFVKPVFQDLLGLKLAGLEQVHSGFEGNLTNIHGLTWTGGLMQFPDNGHFSIYCNLTALDTYVEFLRSKAATGTARIENLGERGWTEGGDTDFGCTFNENK